MPIIAVCGLGSPLGARLLARLDQDESIERIIGVDTSPPPRRSSKLSFHKIEPDGRYETLFADEGVTNAIHIGLDGQDRFEKAEDYTRGFDAFFKATTVAGCQTLTLLSSIFAYGAHPDSSAVLFEGSSLRPTSFLGEAARSLELKSYEYVHTYPEALLQIIRAALIVGPTTENFLNRGLRRKAFVFTGPAELAFQFVHEDDAARALHCMTASEKTGVFNLAADSALTIEQVTQLSEVRLTRWPRSFIRAAALMSRALNLKDPPWFPMDALEHTLHQTLVTNVKFRHEVYFDFLYTGPEAFLESLMDPDPLDERFLDELIDEVPEDLLEDELDEDLDEDLSEGVELSPEEEESLLRSSAEDALEAAGGSPNSAEEAAAPPQEEASELAETAFVDELARSEDSGAPIAEDDEVEVATDSEITEVEAKPDRGPETNDGDPKASTPAVV